MRFPIAGDGSLAAPSIQDSEALCNGNDLIVGDGGTVHMTRHLGSCGALVNIFEQMVATFGMGRAKVMRIETAGSPRVITDKLLFANGIAPGPDAGELWVADTRSRSIRRLAGGRVVDVLELEGGPDNLNIADDGSLLVAVHPSPFRLFLSLKGWASTAASRLIKIAPDGRREVIFEDDGSRYAGATSVIDVGDAYVAGSVLSPSLLVCAKAGPQ